jgi:hypothetical protein
MQAKSAPLIPNFGFDLAYHSSPSEFVAQALNYRHPARAATLAGVVNWFATIDGAESHAEQLAKLEHWASSAHPEESKKLGLKASG